MKAQLCCAAADQLLRGVLFFFLLQSMKLLQFFNFEPTNLFSILKSRPGHFWPGVQNVHNSVQVLRSWPKNGPLDAHL